MKKKTVWQVNYYAHHSDPGAAYANRHGHKNVIAETMEAAINAVRTSLLGVKQKVPRWNGKEHVEVETECIRVRIDRCVRTCEIDIEL